jgi:hypothetical protein
MVATIPSHPLYGQSKTPRAAKCMEVPGSVACCCDCGEEYGHGLEAGWLPDGYMIIEEDDNGLD